MPIDFPELSTIGALFRFASAMEQAAIAVLDAAAEASGDAASTEALSRMATKHRRRADELELARKEKLNETVLEPLMDMPNTPYIPSLPSDIAGQSASSTMKLAHEVETKTEAFYGDAVEKAGPVLAEVRRLFTRFQKESGKNAKALSGMS